MVGRHDLVEGGAMGRRMHMWRFGWYGKPVIVFPSAAGFAHEWQSQGMVDALAPFVGSGKVKLYCPESNVSESWTKKDRDVREGVRRFQAYERWVIETLVPMIRKDCRAPNIRISVTGCSLGATYAAIFALKYPEIFEWALCMSGRYELRNFTNGFDSPEVFFSNPLAFVPGLQGEALERVKQNTSITLVCGQGKYEEGNIEETAALGALLRKKGIPSETDMWGKDVIHDWPWWKRQAAYHFTRRFGA